MPTNENEGTADREYEGTFTDATSPIVGAWLIGICLMLTVGVIIDVLIQWLAR